jgi:type IV pilus assembly protein PilV
LHHPRQTGFTLAETLVALFVLALGMLGAAASQNTAARLRQQAALHSEALQLAASFGVRMQVNPAQAQLPDAANPYLNFAYDGADGDPPAPPVDCHGVDCDPARLAAFDLYQTARQVQAAFPGGRILVCRDARAWNVARQALEWPCSAAPGAPVVLKLGWRAAAGADADPDASVFIALVVAA